ncbi:MAG: YHS domain-containing (seleno)protein [Candidatus Puniceispirillaceae bacterium]
MTTRRDFLLHAGYSSALISAAITFASPAFADKAPVYANRGVAIRGTDPVAYFTQNRAVRGHKDFSFMHDGAEFRFSSAENLALFAKDPEKYAPQYGGYCAWAVSLGYTASTIPEAFSIVDGKLYLNYSLRVRSQWESDRDNRIILADQNWPAVLAQ